MMLLGARSADHAARRRGFAAFVSLAAALLLALPANCWADDGNQVDTGQLPDSSFVYATSIFELQSSDTYYEGQTVQVTGEVVGDIIYDETDGDRRWITLSSLPGEQPATIQVYVTADQAALIDTVGRYQMTGSIVSVMGRFHLVCGQHDGLTDLHATSLAVVQAGSRRATAVTASDFVPAASLVVAGIALLVFYRHRREKMR